MFWCFTFDCNFGICPVCLLGSDGGGGGGTLITNRLDQVCDVI